MSNKFELKNRDEVIIFEKYLHNYCQKRSNSSYPKYISLVPAYEQLHSRRDGGRIFTALLDLHISFILTYDDVVEIANIWNNNFSKGKLEKGSILDNEHKFIGKILIHRYFTSFVLRYRALWDKIMGLLILFFLPDKYDKFISADHRRKKFNILAKEITVLNEELILQINQTINEFDNKFRTSEAHGTGVLRKWTFLMESMDENPQIEIIKFWNAISKMVGNIGRLFYPKGINDSFILIK